MKGDGDTNPALHEWENLHASAASATRRMRVPGGWLYQTVTGLPGDTTVAVGLAFVPDPAAAGPDVPYTCPTCRRTSHHPDDARHRYCAVCGFEDDRPQADGARRT